MTNHASAAAALNGASRTLPPGNIVIVGAGLAGLFTALKLAPRPVTVVAAAPLGEGASSAWAQGGIAASVGEGDSLEDHAADTIAAGGGIVDPYIARLVAGEASERVRDLLAWGVPFDRDLAGHFVLSKEAAHSRKRIVRVSGDRAGAAIMQALIATVRATPSIRVLEGYEADDLVTGPSGIEGVRLIRTGIASPSFYEFVSASAVVLATGGTGSLYAVTTNPVYARGEAIAMAARAGATIADAEFVQFHPTAFDVGADPAPLATEALRGEGATLINSRGIRFMEPLDPAAELAARDIVARGVFAEIAAGRGAYLDCRTAIGSRFPAAFPTVYAHCRNHGIDPLVEPIPVAPAAHYHMGGIATDEHGRTTVKGLWAVGEAASTGLHGANRLASNSLLEAVVFGARVADDVAASTIPVPPRTGFFTEPRRLDIPCPASGAQRTAAIARLRRIMSDSVGVIRDTQGLKRALAELREIESAAAGDGILANLVLTARFIATAALLRTETRGAHARSDFPEKNAGLARRSFLTLRDLERTVPRTPAHVPAESVQTCSRP